MDNHDGHDDAVNDDAREPEAAAPQPDARELGAAGIADLLAGLAANPAAEPAPEQVAALFAVALDGEPPSAVTAESVLREVRAAEAARPARFLSADWFAEHATVWKWGGGLVAAAAVIGAVAVVAPTLGGSATSASLTAGAVNDAAVPESGAGTPLEKLSQQIAEPPSESAAASAMEAPELALASADSATSDAGGGEPYSALLEGSDTASDAQTSAAYDGDAGGAAAGTTDGGPTTSGLGGAREACTMAPLSEAERLAVTRVLGAQSIGVDALCGVEGARGGSVRLVWRDAAIEIALAPASQPAELMASQSADGSLAVTDRSATWQITVTATPEAAAHLDTAALTELAKAVLVAAG